MDDSYNFFYFLNKKIKKLQKNVPSMCECVHLKNFFLFFDRELIFSNYRQAMMTKYFLPVAPTVRPTSFRTGVIFFLRIPRLKYFFINHIFKTI